MSNLNVGIIDIECTCDDVDQFARNEIEIIEIGGVVAALGANSCTIIDEFQLFVRPQAHMTLTHFCTGLTGIAQTTADNAGSLQSALAEVASRFQYVSA